MDQLSDGRLLMAMAAGWYKREFDAVGVPFEQRGKIMDENLDILKRFWTEDMVKGEWPHHKIPAGVMYPKPVQKPRPPILIGGYVDVCSSARRSPATAGSPISTGPRASRSRGRRSATSRRKPARTPTRCINGAQLPIMIGKSRAAVESRDDGVARQGMGLRRPGATRPRTARSWARSTSASRS